MSKIVTAPGKRRIALFVWAYLLAGCTCAVAQSYKNGRVEGNLDPQDERHSPAFTIIVEARSAHINDVDPIARYRLSRAHCDEYHVGLDCTEMSPKHLVFLTVHRAALAEFAYRYSCYGRCSESELREKIEAVESDERTDLLERVRFLPEMPGSSKKGVPRAEVIDALMTSPEHLKLIIGAFDQPPKSVTIALVDDSAASDGSMVLPSAIVRSTGAK